MRCPKCRHPKTSVAETRWHPSEAFDDYNLRRRTCDKCGHRFITYEGLSKPDSAFRSAMAKAFSILKPYI